MLIKICGLRQVENILNVSALSPDYYGLIFYEKSMRYVPDDVAESLSALGLPFVGVFVDASVKDILAKIKTFHLAAVQLHGNESVAFIQYLKVVLLENNLPDIKIFKAFGISEDADFQEVMSFCEYCDLFIFDTKTPLHGGSGVSYDWSILSHYFGATPFLLSGGIGADDAVRVRTFSHQQFAGVDLNSRFERDAAWKDVDLLKEFLENLS
jgi:phosphoribosylanthranilate isomerase